MPDKSRGILFRVDGSRELGMGHVVRCISLAGTLQKKSELPIHFAIKNYPSALDTLYSSGFHEFIHILPINDEIPSFNEIVRESNPLSVIVDIDLREKVEEFQESIYPGPILVSLHEHNYGILEGDLIFAPTIRPLDLNNSGTPGLTHFTGAEYVILAAEISEYREKRLPVKFPPERGFVSMGGGDPKRLTYAVLMALTNIRLRSMRWDVVLGMASDYKIEAVESLTGNNVQLIQGSELSRTDFVRLLSESDLVVTNGGTTLYESLAMGNPTLAISQNEFEADVISILNEKGACKKISNVVPSEITREVLIMTDDTAIVEMGNKGSEYIDGKGSERIADLILRKICS